MTASEYVFRPAGQYIFLASKCAETYGMNVHITSRQGLKYRALPLKICLK